MERGYCHCGCGERTSLATRTKRSRGDVAGEPVKYILGHRVRRPDPMWIEDETGCWLWQWATRHGYGAKNVRKDGRHTSTPAHRWVYEQHVGPIPEGHQLHHVCGNTVCVNPAHMECVTQLEHNRRNRANKLTLERAREIRELVAAGWQKCDIAEAYGVTPQHVRDIDTQKVWAEAA